MAHTNDCVDLMLTMSERNEIAVDVPIDPLCGDFDIVSKILGRDGENMIYIERKTGTKLMLQGIGMDMFPKGRYKDGPLQIVVSHALPQYRKLGEDFVRSLVQSITNEYQRHLESKYNIMKDEMKISDMSDRTVEDSSWLPSSSNKTKQSKYEMEDPWNASQHINEESSFQDRSDVHKNPPYLNYKGVRGTTVPHRSSDSNMNPFHHNSSTHNSQLWKQTTSEASFTKYNTELGNPFSHSADYPGSIIDSKSNEDYDLEGFVGGTDEEHYDQYTGAISSDHRRGLLNQMELKNRMQEEREHERQKKLRKERDRKRQTELEEQHEIQRQEQMQSREDRWRQMELDRKRNKVLEQKIQEEIKEKHREEERERKEQEFVLKRQQKKIEVLAAIHRSLEGDQKLTLMRCAQTLEGALAEQTQESHIMLLWQRVMVANDSKGVILNPCSDQHTHKFCKLCYKHVLNMSIHIESLEHSRTYQETQLKYGLEAFNLEFGDVPVKGNNLPGHLNLIATNKCFKPVISNNINFEAYQEMILLSGNLASYYCPICDLECVNPELWINHCQSVEHKQMCFKVLSHMGWEKYSHFFPCIPAPVQVIGQETSLMAFAISLEPKQQFGLQSLYPQAGRLANQHLKAGSNPALLQEDSQQPIEQKNDIGGEFGEGWVGGGDDESVKSLLDMPNLQPTASLDSGWVGSSSENQRSRPRPNKFQKDETWSAERRKEDRRRQNRSRSRTRQYNSGRQEEEVHPYEEKNWDRNNTGRQNSQFEKRSEKFQNRSISRKDKWQNNQFNIDSIDKRSHTGDRQDNNRYQQPYKDTRFQNAASREEPVSHKDNKNDRSNTWKPRQRGRDGNHRNHNRQKERNQCSWEGGYEDNSKPGILGEAPRNLNQLSQPMNVPVDAINPVQREQLAAKQMQMLKQHEMGQQSGEIIGNSHVQVLWATMTPAERAYIQHVQEMTGITNTAIILEMLSLIFELDPNARRMLGSLTPQRMSGLVPQLMNSISASQREVFQRFLSCITKCS